MDIYILAVGGQIVKRLQGVDFEGLLAAVICPHDGIVMKPGAKFPSHCIIHAQAFLELQNFSTQKGTGSIRTGSLIFFHVK